MLTHYTAHLTDDLWLEDWEEHGRLWRAVLQVAPDAVGLCVMGNHFHLLHRSDAMLTRVRDGCAAFARWLNMRRGRSGPVWRRAPAPKVVSGRGKERSELRYVLLNPCRARVVSCPLAWPFSTLRDDLGLAIHPVRPRVSDPITYHRSISADVTTCVDGTPLPGGWRGTVELAQIAAAVSETYRQPLEEVRRRPDGRRLLVGAARALQAGSAADLADYVQLSTRQVRRLEITRADLRIVQSVLGDERFPGLVRFDPRLLGRRSR